MLQFPPRHSAVWKSRPVHDDFSLFMLSFDDNFEPAGDVVKSKFTPIHVRRRICIHSDVQVLQSDHADHLPPVVKKPLMIKETLIALRSRIIIIIIICKM